MRQLHLGDLNAALRYHDLPGLAAAGVALAAIPNAGHDLMNDNPDAFAAALVAAFGD